MDNRKKIIVGIIVVAVLGSAMALKVKQGQNRGVDVRMEAIERRDLVELVTASGNIRARRTVPMSSEVSAKVARLLVEEGQDVTEGQVLLRLDPAQYQAAVSRSEAMLSQARAQEAQQQANLLRVQRDLDRLLSLRARDSILVSTQQIDDARTNVEVGEATLSSAQHGVAQAQAALDEARDRLAKTIIKAPMDGKVTRLNVEEGETVIIGTMNNPGSLIITISDLSVVEVVVQVDETDVPGISLGDSASVRIDAFPEEKFSGRVTEIGNSAINPPTQQTSGQQAAIDFEVVITLDPTDVLLRPDLSATAEIVTETRRRALSVPIIALTVRGSGEVGSDATEDDNGDPEAEEAAAEEEDVEGVFVVDEGTVRFVPVEVGIAGQEYFEILSGIAEGDTVVAGPYQRIRQLHNGDAVRRGGSAEGN
ncbi:MAG: efflux RND transporter periplasmic adaptor subunit [Gemmatimonadota bacterium]|nr:efflux RND transporter periplasmic adaptor subunit [Gemmatimonadota bacterium]MDH5758588.1 efflux RND transporter periplasmic adaptor subunit [Gemmatimonadota bacterium]